MATQKDQGTDSAQGESPNAVGRAPSAKAHGTEGFPQSENDRQPAEGAVWEGDGDYCRD